MLSSFRANAQRGQTYCADKDEAHRLIHLILGISTLTIVRELTNSGILTQTIGHVVR